MKLAPQQAKILSFLEQNEGRMFSTKDIAKWLAANGYPDASSESVKVQLFTLRHQLSIRGEYEIIAQQGVVFRRRNAKVSG
jgi:DNA-binding response OmpR family regulator